MEKNKNETNIILLLVVIIVAVAYYFLLPRFARIKQLNLDVAVKDKEATALDEKVTALRDLQTKFKAKPDLVNQLKIALPKDSNVEEIIYMVSTLGTNSGVIIENIQPTGGNAEVGTTTANISVTVSGDYNAITKFSNGLSNNLRPVKQFSTTLVAQDAEEDPSRISATFDLGFIIAKQATVQTNNTEGV